MNVLAVIRNNDNEYLTVSRRDNHNDFGFPGGKVDNKETHQQALKREVFEETGYIIDVGQLLFDDSVTFAYYCNIVGGTEGCDSSEGVIVWQKEFSGSYDEYNAHVRRNYEAFCNQRQKISQRQIH